ncbi:type VI secretion system accessory protein TagJ [Rhizobium sp. FKY42]|uniref:type VI secretion system accessory protein TagJ n=1 Tax=Rhizobium sp. FKY42 TaxID=2562310 RepID=UPI0010C0FABD|nr:type VI secretion system accessory protein TagJ [Rhizobium sp. FKY42]
MTLFQQISGKLAQDELDVALDLAKSAVRTGPADPQLRHIYIDLLILAGDYERADNQCAIAATLQPDAVMGFALLRNQLRGMAARDAWFRDGAVPDFPGGPTQLDQLAMKLSIAAHEGDAITTKSTLEALEALRGERAIRINGNEISDFRDLDDRIPHALEVIMNGGAYLWIDFSKISLLRIEPMRRHRDIAFRQAELTLMDGAVAPVLLPAIYHQGKAVKAESLLGRSTDWQTLPTGLTVGQGHRCFLAGDQLQALSDLHELASYSGRATSPAPRSAHG